MEKELIDYSLDSLDTTQIWMVYPPQHLAKQTLENLHVLDVQVGEFISELEDDVASLNDLGFIQLTPEATSEFLYSLQDKQPQMLLKIPSPSELHYWEYEK